jgi:hypothetical protein
MDVWIDIHPEDEYTNKRQFHALAYYLWQFTILFKAFMHLPKFYL